MTLQDIPAFIKHLLDSITAYSIWAWLMVIGLVLIAFSLVRHKPKGKFIWDLQLRNTPQTWSLIVGVILLGLSQASVLIHLQTARKISAAESFKRLRDNTRVRYLIRIITYDYQLSRDTLSVGKLTDLGPPGEEFVFVGDYEELRNYTVQQAIYKLGNTYSGLKHLRATVIIFPLDNRMLYPANARGLMQVVQIVDTKHQKKKEPAYNPFEFTAADSSSLSNTQLESYAWKNMQENFTHYADMSATFKKNNYGAAQYIGKIADDWKPEGYAKVEGLSPSDLDAPDFELQGVNNQDHKLTHYGARVFLIENLHISDVRNVILCGFSDLENDHIPDIGGKSDNIISGSNSETSDAEVQSPR
jgi:hypothetical protein